MSFITIFKTVKYYINKLYCLLKKTICFAQHTINERLRAKAKHQMTNYQLLLLLKYKSFYFKNYTENFWNLYLELRTIDKNNTIICILYS